MPETLYFFDTVTLSNFALSGALDALQARYGRRLRVPGEVLDEIACGVAAGHGELREIEKRVDAGDFGRTDLSSAERRVFGGLLHHLGAGEAACVACAVCRGGVCATDDRTARACCAERGVPCTGTIGILRACCEDGTVSLEEADGILASMVQRGFYSPVRTVSGLS